MVPGTGSPGAEFFDRIGRRDRSDLCARGVTRAFERDESLFSQGHSADAVFVVLKGCVKVVADRAPGPEVILAFRRPGSLVGEHAAIESVPHAASARAAAPTEALAVCASAFRAFLTQRPRVQAALMAVLSERLRDSEHRRVELASACTVERLAARLVELTRGAKQPPVTLPITQEELAGWTAASIESVTRALRTMRGAGWVETGRGFVVVHDVDALARLAA